MSCQVVGRRRRASTPPPRTLSSTLLLPNFSKPSRRRSRETRRPPDRCRRRSQLGSSRSSQSTPSTLFLQLLQRCQAKSKILNIKVVDDKPRARATSCARRCPHHGKRRRKAESTGSRSRAEEDHEVVSTFKTSCGGNFCVMVPGSANFYNCKTSFSGCKASFSGRDATSYCSSLAGPIEDVEFLTASASIRALTSKFRSKAWKECVLVIVDRQISEGRCKHCDNTISAKHGA